MPQCNSSAALWLQASSQQITLAASSPQLQLVSSKKKQGLKLDSYPPSLPRGCRGGRGYLPHQAALGNLGSPLCLQQQLQWEAKLQRSTCHIPSHGELCGLQDSSALRSDELWSNMSSQHGRGRRMSKGNHPIISFQR